MGAHRWVVHRVIDAHTWLEPVRANHLGTSLYEQTQTGPVGPIGEATVALLPVERPLRTRSSTFA